MKRSEREAASVGSHHLLRTSLPALGPEEAFEGAEILHEVPSVPALLLTQAYRAVMAWAPAAPHDLPELFAPTAAEEMDSFLRVTPVADDLRAALEVVRGMVADPAGADPRRLVDACTGIAAWALRHEAPETAFRFTQAAGMCAPNDARLAYRAGCMARQRGIWQLAELWFRHATSVGRRKRDWEGHAMGYLGLGKSYYLQGKHPSAQREQRKALRIAARHGLLDIRGGAHHDLFLVAVERSDPQAAERHAQAAFHSYGPAHPVIPALAHDIAYFWNVQGSFARALPVFRALLLHFYEPEDRLRVLASVARAAGGSGDRVAFSETATRVWRLAQELEGAAVTTTSLLQVAYGAARLSEWEQAEQAAAHALEIAHRRNESDVVVQAEQMLDSIAGRQAEAGVDSTPAAVQEGEADAFVADLVNSLHASAATG